MPAFRLGIRGGENESRRDMRPNPGAAVPRRASREALSEAKGVEPKK